VGEGEGESVDDGEGEGDNNSEGEGTLIVVINSCRSATTLTFTEDIRLFSST
jgi:hypothetical protein